MTVRGSIRLRSCNVEIALCLDEAKASSPTSFCPIANWYVSINAWADSGRCSGDLLRQLNTSLSMTDETPVTRQCENPRGTCVKLASKISDASVKSSNGTCP